MLNNKNILLVDENQDTRTSLKLFLEKEGSYVLEAHDGARALEIFQTKQDKIDLIIMEIVLPIYDGWTVCREIRKRSTLPILILTARNADFDEIHGFEVGADDYLRKPTNPSSCKAIIVINFPVWNLILPLISFVFQVKKSA